MEISSLTSYFQRLQELKNVTNTQTTSSQEIYSQPTSQTIQTDMYIPSGETRTEPIPSENYNNMFKNMGQIMPPPQPMDMSQISIGKTSTDSSQSDTSEDSILSQISQSMNVRSDSIFDTMNSLGIEESDLTDLDTMEELLTALNEGAAQKGLPSFDDFTSILDQLLEESETTASKSTTTDNSIA